MGKNRKGYLDDPFIKRVKSALSSPAEDRKIDEKFKPSAVLVPLVKRNDEWSLVFTKRTEAVDHHKGEFSFPGGTVDPSDRNALDTALREMEEEVGVSRDDITIIGELEPVLAAVSFFIIYPFVGIMGQDSVYKINHEEIERVLEVPINALLNMKDVREETLEDRGIKFKVYFYEYKGDIIWGATARILRQFLDIVRE